MKLNKFSFSAVMSCVVLATSAQAFDVGSVFPRAGRASGERTSAPDLQGASVNDANQVEVAFSPEGGGEALVVKSINSAKKSIRIAAYSFTSVVIAKALLEAKGRGVDIGAVVDYKNNISEDRSGKAKAALNLLVNANIPVRTISKYPIHHDKYIVIDGLHIETGSFNYSQAAAHRNSENVIVLWNRPVIAEAYLKHWQNRFEQGQAYSSSF